MKKILIGLTGSIAAYKIAELIRQLKREEYDVRVVMTASATSFISPLTLQVLSGHEVRSDLFDVHEEGKIDHIALARWPDYFLIAPATANCLAKLAHGLADDLLSTIYLATTAPVLVAPAMNQAMWHHGATQRNLLQIQSDHCTLIPPNAGDQACGETGDGRMAEPHEIVEYIKAMSQTVTQSMARVMGQATDDQPLRGKKLLITAGATIERIDPVRYLTNDSSGKMGVAIAEAAQKLGAQVTLICGKISVPAPPNTEIYHVDSAQAMHDTVLQHVSQKDWFIATAAVADFRIAEPSEQKIKKQKDQPHLTLTLIKNPDILKSVCELPNPPFTIGFAAETENVIENAKIKRAAKGVDIICANDVSNPNIGFNSDDNALTLIGDNWERVLPKASKQSLAKSLLLACIDYIKQSKPND